MFKNFLSSAARLAVTGANATYQNVTNRAALIPSSTRSITSLLPSHNTAYRAPLLAAPIQPETSRQDVRTVTKYSIRKGKRKSVTVVLQKFKRLHWGGWIRRIAGSHKKLWKKSGRNKRRLETHVFCNATQCTLLDKMVGRYWQRPRYYVDDPYGPYHSREEWVYTSKQPRPYIPPEER